MSAATEAYMFAWTGESSECIINDAFQEAETIHSTAYTKTSLIYAIVNGLWWRYA